MSEAKTEPLPRRFRTAGYSHSHTAIEVMDQTGAQAPFVLADAGNGQLFALALCESDAGDGPRLVGEELELVLRRRAGDIGPGDAIRYVRKLAASAATRRKFKNQTKVEGRKP